ncbi:MAG: DUF1868 domain-containing protein [Alphaproteobacteria bacterium]|nr:DUF1868 domain-containing protein [Alphaproteobacteria bacterium]
MAPSRPNEIEHLTGRLSDLPRPPGILLLNGGGKFTPDGAVQHWPGNTFICHVDRRSHAFEAMRELQENVKKSVFNRFFTFLPPPSFHMTVYQGLSPGMKPGSGWPEGIPEGLSPDDVNALLLERLDRLALSTSYRIKVDGLFAGYSLTVSGADEAEERALRQTRLSLRDATGITFEDFDSYVFHITMAYLIDWLSDGTARELVDFSSEISRRFLSEIGTIELGPVEFCTFDTMHHFELVKTLT